MERLAEQYKTQIAPKLIQEFGLKNIMQAPKLTKIVLNVGVGKYKDDKKKVEAVFEDVKKIAGQAPVYTSARKSISGFKVRENQIVGITCTLRGEKMYSFFDKLVNIALPRVRDFQGLPLSSFDKKGAYHLGIKEHIVFPEISAEALDHVFGMEVSIVTNAEKPEHVKSLLQAYKFPFKKN